VKPRVAAVVEKPIQFYAPHYRQIERDGRIDLEVLFLSDRGIKPFDFHGATVRQEASVLEGYKWKMVKTTIPLQASGGIGSAAAPHLWNALVSGGYDAVWIHGYNSASLWLAFAGCLRHRIPILLRGESENFFERSLPRTLIKRAALSPLFRQIAAFLYIGTCNRAFYKDYGVPDERLFYVPYGVDNDWMRGSDEEHGSWRQAIRQELGLAEDALVFVFASKHRHPKRPADAVEAFCRLPPKPDTALIMLGDGELRKATEDTYRARTRGHRVIFAGLQPYSRLREYLAASDVMVFPSVENWGMAINEALASGLAVLSSDQVAGWFDMVKPGFNGLVFRAGSVDSLTAHLTALLEHPDLVHQMKRASLRVADTMGLEQMTDGLVEALAYSIGQQRGRTA